MAWTSITYSCGHTGELQLFGSSRSREYAIANAERGLCPDCYEAKLAADRAAATAAAAAEAAEQELPALEGTDKQVAWALTIRQQFLAALDQWLADNPVRADVDPTPLLRAVAAIQGETSAHWWIENGRSRDGYSIRLLIVGRLKDLKRADETGIPATPSAPAPEAPTLRPETAVSETIAVVAITGDLVTVTFSERRDDFRQIVKDNGFAWTDGRWTRKTGLTTGAPADRAAEVAIDLLAAGFVVRVLDDGARAKAIAGEYAPEILRWVAKRTGGEYDGWFSLSWERDAEEVYQAARKVPGSRWAKPNVVIPAAQFEAVIDIADEFGFALTPGAQALVDAARQAKEAALVIKPEPKPRKGETKQRTADGEIDASLRDDD
jgi:hypothetical protein